jgi:hypothetical protein
LFHHDHLTAAAVALALLALLPEKRWIAYEDVPYRRIHGLVQRRLSALLDHGIVATPCSSSQRSRSSHLRQTLAFAAKAASTNPPLRTLLRALRGLPWALRNRHVVPPHVEAQCRLVEIANTARPWRSRRALQSPERIAPLDLRFVRVE